MARLISIVRWPRRDYNREGRSGTDSGELDVLAGDELAAGLGSATEALTALAEARVEVTPLSVGEEWN